MNKIDYIFIFCLLILTFQSQTALDSTKNNQSDTLLQPINKDLKVDNTSLLQRTNSLPINRINANDTITANQNLVLKDTVVMSFLKYKISHSADSSIFNVLKIINYKKETFYFYLNDYNISNCDKVVAVFDNNYLENNILAKITAFSVCINTTSSKQSTTQIPPPVNCL